MGAQSVSGDAQVAEHPPREHTCPTGHATAQPPQLPLSVRRSASQPSPAAPSQSAKPAAQVATAQEPAAQVATALARVHARPQLPQCAAVVVRSVSQPLAAVPSQSPYPEAQDCTTHSPAAQPLVARSSAQAIPHIPQLDASDAVLAQRTVVVPALQVA
ncbi:MAG: hypothetical protein HY909_29965 [Deltaproteobacteria bacterium]|nr:hypothetical protein [Deltaproteobacteria bacterium]